MFTQEILRSLQGADCIYPTKILKQHWKESEFSYLELPRPDFGFLLILSGRADFVTEDGVLSAKAGNMIFLPKDCRYKAIFLHEVDDYLVCFDMKGTHLSIPVPIRLSEKASLSCAESFRATVEENFSEGHTKLRSQGVFYLLLDAIIKDAEAEAVKDRRVVDLARELLRKEDNISVSDIAKECAISESGLRRLFKEQMGMTPVGYRTELRLRRAIYLLDSTDLSVNEIAAQSNFFDAAYFCKVFRARFGITPKQYVKSKKL